MRDGTRDSPTTNWRFVRLFFLVGLLIIVVAYAAKDVWQRKSRNAWKRPLEVALVLAERSPVDPDSLPALRQRLPELERRLAVERVRYGDGPVPFHFQVFGPVPVSESPPKVDDDSLLGLLRHAFHTWRYFRDLDERAAVPTPVFDSLIHLIVRPPASADQNFIEGQSEQGGRIGSVEVELDTTMVDFALFVATHELLHTVGASDKYDERGQVLLPNGLAEPERQPLYPQVAAEVMARNVVLKPGSERPPDTLDELRIGSATAREIGWIR